MRRVHTLLIMSQSSKQRRPIWIAGGGRFPVKMRCFSGLVLGALLMALGPAQAEEPEDQFLRIYNLIDQADALSANGQTGPALVKYRGAQAGLINLRRTYHNWNEQLVSFRMDYVAGKIAALSETSASAATAATTSATMTSGQAKVLEAGGEPRKVLRLDPKPGEKQ